MRHVILFCLVLLKQAANQNCRMDHRSLAEVVNLMPAGNTGRLPEYPAFIDLTAGINRHPAFDAPRRSIATMSGPKLVG
jgi:hypothetical protein